MTRRRKKPLKKGKRSGRSVPPYPHEFRLKVARLYVEDGYPAKLIASQFGIRDYSVYTWGKRYREHGEQGLVYQPQTTSGSTKLPEAVSQSIVDLKKENPGYGARRIRDILKRFFLVGTSESPVPKFAQICFGLYGVSANLGEPHCAKIWKTTCFSLPSTKMELLTIGCTK